MDVISGVGLGIQERFHGAVKQRVVVTGGPRLQYVGQQECKLAVCGKRQERGIQLAQNNVARSGDLRKRPRVALAQFLRDIAVNKQRQNAAHQNKRRQRNSNKAQQCFTVRTAQNRALPFIRSGQEEILCTV